MNRRGFFSALSAVAAGMVISQRGHKGVEGAASDDTLRLMIEAGRKLDEMDVPKENRYILLNDGRMRALGYWPTWHADLLTVEFYHNG